MRYRAVAFTAREKAELAALDDPGPLGARQVWGRTLYTLVSPGTELAYGYQGLRYQGQASYPVYPGYAAVFRIEEAGAEVEGLRPGDVMFCMGRHQSVQQVDACNVVPVPEGLAHEIVPLARLMGVSMTTLMTTAARPGERVMVTGAGPVGYLGAQVFKAAGYEVLVVEPDEQRRQNVVNGGISAVYPRVPVDDPQVADTVALALECSGHERAVLDACRVVRKRGEVVLVGVPWRRQTDVYAHDVLIEVFHRYVVLRSGWEWEIPHHVAEFRPHSIYGDFRTALRWLAEGKIAVEGLIRLVSPADAPDVYRSHLHKTTPALFSVFDWGLVE
jgi:threonine dehydrogenase-like Zn-dependent dehydrogenase